MSILGTDLSLGTIDESYLPEAERWKQGHGKYLSPTGHPELVQLICEYEQVEAPCVVITAGASLGLTSAFSVAARDRSVLLPRPFYPAYKSIAEVLCIEVAYYDLAPRENDEAVADRIIFASVASDAGAVLINTPGNPLGNVLSRTAFERVAAHAREHKKILIVDETYADLIFEPSDTDWSGIGVIENVLRIRSFSKYPMLAGSRIGYIVAPINIAIALRRAHWAVAMCPSFSSQLMAARHLRESAVSRTRDLVDRLRQARDIAFDTLIRCGVETIEKPRAGVFLWIPTDKFGLTGSEAAMYCASKANIQVMPGEPFCMEHGIRASFASAPAVDIKAAFEKLANTLKDAAR